MKKKCSILFLLAIAFTALIVNNPAVSADDSEKLNPALFSHLKYRCVGPTRGGRVTAVAGVTSKPGVFYMGGTGGGVWKTTNYGTTWSNVSDGHFETPSIGSIRVFQKNPDIIFVGTGSDGIRSNVITGRGVYKSANGGKSWAFAGLRNTGQIGAVLIHPENPEIVYIAAIGNAFKPSSERGVYRTVDGGKVWEKVLFISNSTGAVDLEFAPDNPEQIYASMWQAERKPWTIMSGGYEGGILRSDDGGSSWKKLKNGLPSGLIGKSDLAVSAANPSLVYVLVEAPDKIGGLYRSVDRGENFELVTTYASLLDRPFYYLNLDADPNDPDILFANSTGFFKSTDGGKTWSRRSTPHGDNHDIWINPDDSDLFIQANDGGANVTRDGGLTWSTQRNQPTAELYQVNVDESYPYWLYAGQQDNSTIKVPSMPLSGSLAGPSGYWRSIGGCETGPAVPKPGNPDIVYANCKGRFGVFNVKTGQEKQYYVGAANMYGHNPRDLKYRFQRVSPIFVSPHNPDVVYHASQYLHRTTDDGVTWETISPDLTAFTPETQVISGSPITRDITGEEFYSTIYAVAESPLAEGLIWIGANDGPIHVTRDGGKTWKDVTPPDLPKGGRVQTIEPSPHAPERAYVAVYRFLLGDFQPYIYQTDNYGQTWQRLTNGKNGIPADSPTRVVREDPDRAGLLYAGTEFGIFISFNNGKYWQPFQLNLPVTPVTDIKLFRNDLILSTMGRSFWILDNVTSLHQLTETEIDGSIKLFQPRDAYRLRYRGRMRTSSVPAYPASGVMIDYYLKQDFDNDYKLEILDVEGNLIRGFSSKKPKKGVNLPELDGKLDFDLRNAGTRKLPKRTGMHRFTWDMRHAGNFNSSTRPGSRSGPMVSPGTYKVRLSSESYTKTYSFELKIDPNVAASGVTLADIQEQEAISLKIRDLISRSRAIDEHIKLLLKGISEKKKPTNTEEKLLKALIHFKAEMNTADGPYPQPMILDQITYLYRMLDRADQKPGRDAYIRFDELNKMVEEIKNKVKDIKI